MLVCFILGAFVLSVVAYIIVYNKLKPSKAQRIHNEIMDSMFKDSKE